MYDSCPECGVDWSNIEKEIQCCQDCGFQAVFNDQWRWDVLYARVSIYDSLAAREEKLRMEMFSLENKLKDLEDLLHKKKLEHDELENKINRIKMPNNLKARRKEESKRLECGSNLEEPIPYFQSAITETKQSNKKPYSFWHIFFYLSSYAVFFGSGLYLLIWGVKVIVQMWGPIWALLSWVLFPIPIVVAPWIMAIRDGIWIYVIISLGSWILFFILHAISDHFEPPDKPIEPVGPFEVVLTGDNAREIHYQEVNLKIKQEKQGDQWIDSSWTTGSKFFSPQ